MIQFLLKRILQAGLVIVVVNTLVDLLYGIINPMVDLVGRRQ
jgi:ABC-type dipeptide/oligopeptide/nickel transport system permease component